MKAAVLYSGGKDSTMALYKALEEGWEIDYLVSMHSKNPYSYMFHVPNIHLTELLSDALGIPLLQEDTQGRKEEELEDLKKILTKLKKKGIQAVFTGAIASKYQKSRIDRLCHELGMESVAPIWGYDPLEYMNELIELGFIVIITSVAAEGLDESWLGREIDKKSLKDLIKLHNKYGLHLAFEGGEAETLVLDGPIFKKKLRILDSSNVWDKDNGSLIIKDAILENKNL